MAVINGTSENDELIGTSQSDQIYGLDGYYDVLEGRGGNDLLDGGPGDDDLIGGAGNDTLIGGDGRDFFGGFSGLDEVGDDRLIGGAGDDYFQDSYGNNILIGGEGADSFSTLILDGGSDLVTGGPGKDIYLLADYSGVDYVVTDFQVGFGGDLLSLDGVLGESASYYFHAGNPFDPALGFVRFLQSGPDTLVQWDFDGASSVVGGVGWMTLLALDNVNASTITKQNIVGGIPVDGSAIPGRTITATDNGGDLFGALGNDTLIGGAGDDFFGGEGAGYLSHLGNDSMVGGDGDDSFLDYIGDNVFKGGAGADVFSIAGDNGTNILTGGSGRDTYILEGVSQDYRVLDFAPGSGGDLIDLDALLLSEFYPGGNPFDPAIGFIRLVQAGTDTLVQLDQDGTAGSTTGWTTAVTLRNLNLTATPLTVDNIIGGFADDRPGGFDPDGSGTPDIGEAIIGGPGDDVLRGGRFNDTISGLGGNDLLEGLGGDDSQDGGAGRDYIFGGAGDDWLAGGDGNDVLGGGAGNDSMLGGAGDDTFDGGDGNNRLVGGDGADTFALFDDVIEDSDGEAVIGSEIDSSSWTGGAGRDIYRIGFVDDDIFVITDFAVGAGADLLDIDGVLHPAFYTGGNPFDENLAFLRFRQVGNDTVLEEDRDGPEGNELGWKTLVTLQHVDKNAITSDNFAGQFIGGTAGDDFLVGGAGNDTVQGLAGNDTLDGSVGRDTLQGGSGNDIFLVDNARDVVVETSNAPAALLLPGGEAEGPGLAGPSGITDTVIAAVNYSLANVNFVENLTLSGTASKATGNALANVITGNASNNVLDGRDGADNLRGMGGNDTLVWSAADRYDGGTGSDTLKVNGASVTLDLRVIDNARTANIEAINITGTGNNQLKLNVRDVLDMSTSADTLRVDGNAGDVVHRGSGWTAGADQVIGANTYRTYTRSGATLLVDTDVSSVQAY